MAYEHLFEQLPKGSISEIIVDRITKALISGELKPGDKIPTEAEFSEKLGVGRNAVREAIKVLVAFGVLEIRRSEGTFVVSDYNDKLLDPLVYGLIFSEHSMEELLDVKIALSNSLMLIVMKKATDEELDKLQQLGEEFRRCMNDPEADNETCYRASMAFNEYLGEISHNRMLNQLDGIIRKVAAFTRHLALEKTRQQGTPDVLPTNYLKEVELLRTRDRSVITGFMDERLELWKKYLL
jgi:GntR family transcriptional repressor for pyruvate dehydrogenase complex